MGRVQGTDLPGCEVFINEGIGGSSFFGEKGINLAYLRHEGFLHVDLVVVGPGWGQGPSGGFVKYFGEGGILGG